MVVVESIEPTVLTVKEGIDAFLPCSIIPEQNITQEVFEWMKDSQKVFFYEKGQHYNNGLDGQDEQFKGRVSHFPDQLQFGKASIVIRDSKLSDSGIYTCDFPHLQPNRRTFKIKLVVEPTVVKVREGIDAFLPCSIIPEQNITQEVFEWKKDGQKKVFFYERGKLYGSGLGGQDEQFKGRVSHFTEGLQFGKASIVIRDTKLSDSGTYTCDFPHLQPNRRTFKIKLVVGPTAVKLREGIDVVLCCSIDAEQDITGEVFVWKKDGQKVFSYEKGKHYNNGLDGQDEQFKGRVSHFPDQLQFGRAFIEIRDTKLSDSGTYTCDFPHLQPNSQTFNIDLTVEPQTETERDGQREPNETDTLNPDATTRV
ncbi:protein borderless-like [Symphorus nematophorus]